MGALLLAACTAPGTVDGPAWRPLLDPATADACTPIGFGGEGRVHQQGGVLVLEPGSPLTGVLLAADLPERYELEVCAARLQGNDFFCALTFPVAGAHLTLVLGGWGGTVCGLSNLDGLDAAHNDTRRLHHFETGVVQRVRLVVTPARVAVTLAGEPFLACDLRGRQLSLRAEMAPCRPLAVASYATRAAFASVRWRPLPDAGDGRAAR